MKRNFLGSNRNDGTIICFVLFVDILFRDQIRKIGRENYHISVQHESIEKGGNSLDQHLVPFE